MVGGDLEGPNLVHWPPAQAPEAQFGAKAYNQLFFHCCFCSGWGVHTAELTPDSGDPMKCWESTSDWPQPCMAHGTVLPTVLFLWPQLQVVKGRKM